MMRIERHQVTVDVITHFGMTTARAVLVTDDSTRAGLGDASRAGADAEPAETAEARDDLAIGRALVDLGSRLLRDADRRVASIEGESVAIPV